MSSVSIPIPNGFGVKRALKYLGIPIAIENDDMVLFMSRNKNASLFLVWLNNEPISTYYMDLIILDSGITYKDMEETGVLYD